MRNKILRIARNNLPNLALRGFAILGKFILIIYIVKLLSLSDLGEYNLIATTVAMFLFFIGFEFHNYTGRQYNVKKKSNNSAIIFNQLTAHLSIYLVLIPISYFFLIEFIDTKYLLLVYSILIFDHLSQEISRVFVYLKNSSLYNLLFFIKNGGWVFILIIYISFFNYPIDLLTILFFWFGGVLTSFLIGGMLLYKKELLKKQKIDFRWIATGLKTASPFFIMSISFRSIEFSDRYLIEYFLNFEKLGIYSFFFGISSIATTLITSSIAIQYIPLFLEAQNDFTQIKTHAKLYLIKIGIVYIAICIGIFIFMPFLIQYLDKTALMDNSELVWLMILNSIIISVALIPQNILYALNHDKILMFSSIFAAIANLTANFLFIPMLGIYGAVIGTFVAYASLIVIRLFYLKFKVNWKI